MSNKKQVMAVCFDGLKESVLKEINRLASNPQNGLALYFNNFSNRFTSRFVQNIIDYSFGKVVFQSRSWKHIDPLVFQTVMENSLFLNINDNIYSDKILYFENERNFLWGSVTSTKINYLTLENDLLAEIVQCFPFMMIDDKVQFFVQDTVKYLSENFIYNYFIQHETADILCHQFADSYIEIYFNGLQSERYTVLFNRDMKHYIQMVADKEMEFEPIYRQHKQFQFA